MATRTDLQAKIAEVTQQATTNNAEVKTAIGALTAKINAAGDAADYQAEIDQLNALLGVEQDTNTAAQAVIAQG